MLNCRVEGFGASVVEAAEVSLRISDRAYGICVLAGVSF